MAVFVFYKEQGQEPMDVDLVGRSGPSKEEQESIREDGELPSLVPAASIVNENKLSYHKGANLNHSRRPSLLSKRPPISKAKSLSYKKQDVDLDLFLDTESDESECYNELHALEAEVNLHTVKMLPQSEENNILAHQVRCLAMLFDYYMDEASPSSEKRHSTSVVDVGLCKPVSDQIVARSFRGRDRRKMISSEDMDSTSGYPY